MIYLDNAATTSLDSRLLDIMKSSFIEDFYNPSALYSQANLVKTKINNARANILKSIHAPLSSNMIFTASGTEANNLAMFSALKRKSSKIIISALEHSSIYKSAIECQNRGYNILLCKVDEFGRVDIDEFKKLLDDDVELVSIMHVSNETGAINDIKKLCSITKDFSKRIIFHSDGVQAIGKIDVNVSNLGVDLYTIGGHKINGPKGVGALYVKSGIHLKPIIFGGGQEFNIRSATENTPYILALDKIINIKYNELNVNYQKVLSLNNYLREKFKVLKNEIIINSNTENSSPYILSISFKNIRGEVMLHHLESKGILVGTGSACSSNKGQNRAPGALNLNGSYKEGMLRISFSPMNTISEMDELFINIEDGLSLFSKYTRK